ncbi:Transcriptional regulator like [Actinidia chinensis var. chinensis]|uniref:Transcriptional regulator like n=1 Tax=Actinidia chinensis var. chinensis TaxID=1590841 RepID=A0A2R6RY50_ACTCC|nr:Transcriptional regulator like [Actinidia chinensis var. chinensis]
MEFKPTIIGKSDQIVWDSDDHHQVLGHVRSYSCTFCKRGFSNAQALGGHMNIHRKDRAKLKESYGDQTLIPKNFGDENSSQLESSDQEKSCTPKRPGIFSKEDDVEDRGDIGVGKIKQLDLFVEAPISSSKNDQVSDLVESNKESSSGHGSSNAEILDLELRLGSEYHDQTSKGNKKSS